MLSATMGLARGTGQSLGTSLTVIRKRRVEWGSRNSLTTLDGGIPGAIKIPEDEEDAEVSTIAFGEVMSRSEGLTRGALEAGPEKADQLCADQS